MGRTFGILVVLVGLWVMASLPTRGPDAREVARSAPISSSAYTPDATPTADAGARTVLSAAPLEASRESQGTIASQRRNRAEERIQAARSRDLESEPDMLVGDVPRPMPVTAHDRARALSASTTTIAAAPGLAMLGKTTSAATSATSPEAATTRPAQPPATSRPSAVTIPPPRIVTAALRDLAAAPPRTTAPAARATSVPTPVTAHDALRGTPPTKTTHKSAPENPTIPELKGAARAMPAAEPKLPTPSKTAHSGVSVAVARPEPARRSAPPRAPGVRVAYSYAPPSYVGRVYVAYPPQPLYMPSSGHFRRAQFYPEAMWSVIRRSGM